MEINQIKCPPYLISKDLKSDVVADQLKRYILDNNLTAGTKLPTEAELSVALNVSRPSIREAMRSLESLGVIYTVQGKGRFIKEFSYSGLVDAMAFNVQFGMKDFDDILQVRKALEFYFLPIAMRTMTEQDFSELDGFIDQMEEDIRKGKSFKEVAEIHVQFHRYLYRKINNKLLDCLLTMFTHFQKMMDKTITDYDVFIDEHRRMVKSLRDCDIDRIRVEIGDHFHDYA
ncbi:MAG: FadR family transcriptional regulator [Spirochaetales bacterium]|nr:FadR family transcriptional regulator [Spirochaetales bacterium]